MGKFSIEVMFAGSLFNPTLYLVVYEIKGKKATVGCFKSRKLAEVLLKRCNATLALL